MVSLINNRTRRKRNGRRRRYKWRICASSSLPFFLALLLLGYLGVVAFFVSHHHHSRKRHQEDQVVVADNSKRHHQVIAAEKDEQVKAVWQPVVSYEHPFDRFAPQLDLIWTRGWYSAFMTSYNNYTYTLRPPLSYYNERGRSNNQRESRLQLQQWFDINDRCSTNRRKGGGIEYVYLRIATGTISDDLTTWVQYVLPHLEECYHRLNFTSQDWSITLITTDGDADVPTGMHQATVDRILKSPLIGQWYSTNVVLASNHKRRPAKLFPLPIGPPLHFGFPGSPDTVHTVETMMEIRRQALPFRQRNHKILVDLGTEGRPGDRRYQYRHAAKQALAHCSNNNIQILQKGPPDVVWPQYANHSFALAPPGLGYDTYRLWELLLLGTVPILPSTPIDHLFQDAHVPVLIVQDWSDLCYWTGSRWNEILDQYEAWMAHAHLWLQPSLWLPRNQAKMDRLYECVLAKKSAAECSLLLQPVFA